MYSSSAIAKTLRVMNEQAGADKTASRFFAFVERYNLWNLVPSVLAHLEGSAGKSSELETLKVRAPYALSEKNEERIRGLAGADKSVKLEFEIDKTLLGGFVASYHGFEHEGSFERVVNNLEKVLKA